MRMRRRGRLAVRVLRAAGQGEGDERGLHELMSTSVKTSWMNGDAASFSIEIITSGTGEFTNATGYLYVTGFINNDSHVSSSVTGKICTP